MTDMIQQWVSINPDIIEQIRAKTPLRRPAEPIEIANAAAWLLSDYSSLLLESFCLWTADLVSKIRRTWWTCLN